MSLRVSKLKLAAPAFTAGIVIALAGCGSGGVTNAPGPKHPSVSSLIRSMKAGFRNAKSFRVSGNLSYSGKPVTINVGMFRSGDMSGEITVGPLQVTVLSVGGTTYEYISKKFFNSLRASQNLPASECALMCGKYLKVPSSSFSSFSLTAIAHEVDSKIPVPTAVPHIRATRYEGEAAYEMSGQGLKLYVAKNGTHYLLGLVDPAKFGTLNFSQWNAVPPVSAPPASKIFSIG